MIRALGRRWSNWAGNVETRPAEIARPRSEEELRAVVARAAERGQRVKAIGSGHSFPPVAATDGVLVDLRHLDRLVSADLEARRVTVEAGIPLDRLNPILHALGLALPNLGDIAYQTIAGAIATATHGTGARLGNLATAVVGLRLVEGGGEMVECSSDKDGELLRVARVGVGALGILSQVTLQCVASFRLAAHHAAERIDPLLERLDDEVAGHDHFELFWVPHTGWALTKRHDRTERPLAPRGRWPELRDDILVDNVAFGAIAQIGRLRPAWIPRLVRALPNPGTVEYVDQSFRVFASPRWVRFVEMEYALPREAALSAFREARDAIARSGHRLQLPVEFRFVAADDIPLSHATGRATAYLAFHVLRGRPHEAFFREMEAICWDHGGRPHWGKLHSKRAHELATRYPEWDAFQVARRRLDPEGRFANEHLDLVLGARND